MDGDDFMTATIAAIEFLGKISIPDYHASKLPCDTDTKIAEICDLFKQATPTQRQTFASYLIAETCGRLLVFTERMAMLSVREKSYSKLLNGLLALVIIHSRIDLHSIIMVLSLVYSSTIKLDVDAEGLFREAVQYANSQDAADSILSFLSRSPQNQRIEAMGFGEINGPNGLIYWFGNKPIPKGLL